MKRFDLLLIVTLTACGTDELVSTPQLTCTVDTGCDAGQVCDAGACVDWTPRTTPFDVDLSTTKPRLSPNAALGNDGRIWLAWSAVGSDDLDIFFAPLSVSGELQRAPQQLNRVDTRVQTDPRVALAGEGGLVCWSSSIDGTNGAYARPFDAEGALGEAVEILADGREGFSPDCARVDGGYVIAAMRSNPNQTGFEIYLARLDDHGVVVGTPATVSSTDGASHWHPRVAVDGDQNVAVIWERWGQDDRVLMRTFDAQLTPTHDVVTLGPGAEPAIAALPAGFVMAWSSHTSADGSGSAIVARAHDAAGVAASTLHVINDEAFGNQIAPSVSCASAVDCEATWMTVSTAGFTLEARAFSPQSGGAGNEARLAGDLKPYIPAVLRAPYGVWYFWIEGSDFLLRGLSLER